MITVTLGTIPYSFDRSIFWLKALLDSGVINEPVFVQYGTSDISELVNHPLVTAEAVVSQAKLQAMIKRSRLVISHAGQGSTRLLAAAQKHFVLLPRLAKHEEHVDDHQLMFARSVASRGVHHCITFEALEQAVLNPPELCPPTLFEGPKLATHLLKRYPQAVSPRTVKTVLTTARSHFKLENQWFDFGTASRNESTGFINKAIDI